jgi:dienelactone hydrolase
MKRVVGSMIGPALLVASGLAAQSPNARRPLWGDLTPGPYAVGFKVTYRLDRSRTWDPTPDSIAEGESARPIRVSIWYPARPARAARPMPYRAYLMLTAPNRYFSRLNATIERADVTPLRDVIFRGSDSLFQKLLALPTAAFANAPAAAGRFPVIGYSEGYNNRSHDNSVLAEYLASHGFIVVTVPQLGTAATRLTLRINPVDLETQTRDLEFAIGELLAGSNAAPRKLGVMGYSMGGVVALLLAARNPNVDAIVGLDPSIRAPRFVELVTHAPQFEPRNIRAPLLSLQSGNASEASAQDTTVVHALRFADRYVAQVGNAAHGDFSDFAVYADLFGLDVQGRTAGEARQSHAAVSKAVLAFFQSALRGDSAALATALRSSPLLHMRFSPRLDVPSERDFANMVIRHGYESARRELQASLTRSPGVDLIDQPTLNRLGYGLLEQGNATAAVGVFRLNIDAHPKSADAYDSLVDGLLGARDTTAAVAACQQLLAVLDADSTLSADTREEYRRNTQARLQQLGNGVPR